MAVVRELHTLKGLNSLTKTDVCCKALFHILCVFKCETIKNLTFGIYNKNQLSGVRGKDFMNLSECK